MLDKAEYYHGAAIARLLEDKRCRGVKKRNSLGYVVNDEIFIFLKYTTKARSPWGFTFDSEDLDRCFQMSSEYREVILGLVCGGDGVCTLEWGEAKRLLGEKPGRIAARRNHNESYGVSGSEAKLKRKVPVGRWPSLVFELRSASSDEHEKPI